MEGQAVLCGFEEGLEEVLGLALEPPNLLQGYAQLLGEALQGRLVPAFEAVSAPQDVPRPLG